PRHERDLAGELGLQLPRGLQLPDGGRQLRPRRCLRSLCAGLRRRTGLHLPAGAGDQRRLARGDRAASGIGSSVPHARSRSCAARGGMTMLAPQAGGALALESGTDTASPPQAAAPAAGERDALVAALIELSPYRAV